MSQKKTFTSILLVLALVFSVLVPAAQPQEAQAADDILIYVNGTALPSGQGGTIVDGRTMIPLRPIFEALGCEILWDGSNSVIAAYDPDTNKIVSMIINQKNLFCADYDLFKPYESNPTSQATINFVLANSSLIDVPPMLIDGRTMVPVRVVSEALGADVEWNGSTRTVTVNR